jgi:pimeloyl-ACP methyl ester carboxylesterase
LAAASNPWTTPLDPLYRVISSTWGATLVVPLITAWVPNSYVTTSLDAVFAPQSAPAGYAEYFGPGITLRRRTQVANARQRANLLDQIKEQSPRYTEISVPTEILHGTADTTVGLTIHSEPLSRQIDGSVLTVLDGIGHMPQHVAQDAVVAAIHRAAARAGLR